MITLSITGAASRRAFPARPGLNGNFQGYGRYQTGSAGFYQLRTIKSVSYDLNGMFRAPHIHFAVSRNGRRISATQMMAKDRPANPEGLILSEIEDAKARETIPIDFVAVLGSPQGELNAKVDLTLDRMAEETDDHRLHGEIGMAESRKIWRSAWPGHGSPWRRSRRASSFLLRRRLRA